MLKLLKRIFSNDHRRRRQRNRCDAESLESRLLLAAVIDSGDTLTIQLEQDERLEISTNGSQTQFDSSNSVFTGIDLEDELIFSGLSSDSLLLNDLSFYDTVQIQAIGDGASIGFVDSGSSVYGHDLDVDLSNATVTDAAVDFRGSSHLGDHDLTIRSSRRVLFWGGSELTTVDGDIDIQVRNTTDAEGHATRGITLYEAKITTSGTGSVLLDGKASDVDESQSWKLGVDLRNNSVIESTSAAAGAGNITLIGQGGVGGGSLSGVFSADSRISSRASSISINGTAGDGTINFNTGVRLDATVVESGKTGSAAPVIEIEGQGGDGLDSGYGVSLTRETQISSVDGSAKIEGTGDGADWSIGVRLEESGVRATGDGRISMVGVAGESLNISIGIWLDSHSSLEVQSGQVTVDGTNHQDSGDHHHGFEMRDGSTIQSDTGSIHVTGTRTGQADGSGHAVKLWRREDEDPVSIVSRSGFITVNALGDPHVARLQMDRDVTIGGADMTGAIDLIADDFQWINGGNIQSSGRLRFSPANDSDLTLGGTGTANDLSDDELAFLHDGFSEIEIGRRLSGGIIQTLNLDGAVFTDPLTVLAEDIVLSGGTALTAPTTTLGGDVSILTPHSATVDGDVAMATDTSLTLHGFTGGTTLTVTGDFHPNDSDLKIDWAPSPDDVPGSSHVLIERNGGDGGFSSSSEAWISQNLFGAEVQYEQDSNINIRLNIPVDAPLSTTVTKLGESGRDGVTTIFGASAGDRFGQSVAAAGDINGDGVPDLLVGATHVDRDNANDAGAAYLIYGSNEWASEFTIDHDGQNVVTILGADVNDVTGLFVAAGDLNGDGIHDLVIPALFADAANNQKGQAGDIAIVWGAADLPAVIDLVNLGDVGTIISGADPEDRSGNPVEVIGDINGDNLPDLAIGAFLGDGPANSSADVGEVHILFGRSTWPATIDLASNNESHITIYGENNEYGHGDEFGVTVVGLGDVNGDNEDDFSVTAWRADGPDDDRPGAGATYVFFGGGNWDADIDLNTTSAADLIIHGAVAPDRAGWDSHGRGDLTGDGINDLVIATPLVDAADGGLDIGGAVLIPGSATLGGVIDLANPPAEATVIRGSDAGDIAGRTSIVGDLNADGIDDLAVTARLADHPLDFGSNYGETYILLGRSNWPATIDLATPVDLDAVILGADSGDESGTMVRGIGDLNGDGQDEIAIGARYGDGANGQLEDAGEVSIVSGATLFDVKAPVATITTTYGSETSSDVLVYDIKFDEPVLGFWFDDLALTDALGTFDLNSILSQYSRPISDTHYRFAVQRRTEQGSATLSISPNSDTTDVAGNAIDLGSSTAATYQFAEVAPVILQPTGTVSGQDVRLEWQPSRRAEGYEFEIIRLGVESTVWASGQTGSRNSVFWTSSEDLPIGDYRAWVRADLDDGAFGPWGSQAFTVSETVSGIRIDSSVSVDRPTITFDEVTGATGYQIFASNFTSGASGYIDTVLSSNEWAALEDLPTGRYGFWVRAIGENGFSANWSQSVVYDVYPELEPLNATIQQRPVLRWNAVAGAASYEIYVSGGGGVVNESGLTSTSFTLPNDVVVSNYRAWVRGVTSDGERGPWSPVMKFTGGGRTQVSIAAETSGSAVPVFEWWAVEGAVDYEVYVARTGTAGAYYRQAEITSDSFRSIPLPEGDYKVWVKTNFGEGHIAWSSGHSFVVSRPTAFLNSPTGLYPVGPILNQQPTLIWMPVDRAAEYQILLRTGSGTQLITGLTTNQYTPTDPIVAEDSEWWVGAIDNLGRAGAFSEAASFNTSGRPVLTVVPGSNPLFEWTRVLGAERYILQVDNQTTGQSSVIREDELTGTSYTSAGTLPAGSYRAWVRAVSAGNAAFSPWSLLVEFVIDA